LGSTASLIVGEAPVGVVPEAVLVGGDVHEVHARLIRGGRLIAGSPVGLSRFEKYGQVNVWPRPIQQPHPPIWIPGVVAVSETDARPEQEYTAAFIG
jgi:hypothetical protein